MKEQITIQRDGDKLMLDFGEHVPILEKRQELILGSALMLLNILKTEHLKENIDLESFIYKLLDSIKASLQSKVDLNFTK